MMDRLFAPIWAGGWASARVLFVLAALVAHLPRLGQIRDAVQYPGVLLTSGPMRLVEQVQLTGGQATGLWVAGLVGLSALLWGGRAAKPGLVVWLVSYYPMIILTGLSARVPERLFLWVAVGLLMAPISERRLTEKHRSPAARWYLMIVFCALYGSTGWLKALMEPAWWTGEALSYDLVDLHFGLKPAGVWLSGQPGITRALSWGTIVIEASFPLLIWWRRSNPWILLAALCMHLGIELLMTVRALSFVTLAMYPVLLHPEVAQRLSRTILKRP
ncbi:MAG: hypothetical protein ACI8RZ_007201 [Myxococcota bacterium]|jgi:hypothetical protein